ncbi:MAG: phytoene synthase [Bacteroidetes bacterium]|nr:MAG: phytoene synthase [Bacteroidota bacterium]
MKELFDQVSYQCSKAVISKYSTSFSLGVRLLHRDFIDPIRAIYGYVRLADEIVDSFHDYDKKELLEGFIKDTGAAIRNGISLNPILNSFQQTVNKYDIDQELIDAFNKSMAMDLEKKNYKREEFKEYLYGSSEVVGLMCLKVFCEGDKELYASLKESAMQLGSAFQKVNFMRDFNHDFQYLGRYYFPELSSAKLDEVTKKNIEKSIDKDFADGYAGVVKLPKKARFGVYLVYIYYLRLFNKIKRLPAENVLQSRVRISNGQKMFLLARSYVRHSLNLI